MYFPEHPNLRKAHYILVNSEGYEGKRELTIEFQGMSKTDFPNLYRGVWHDANANGKFDTKDTFGIIDEDEYHETRQVPMHQATKKEVRLYAKHMRNLVKEWDSHLAIYKHKTTQKYCEEHDGVEYLYVDLQDGLWLKEYKAFEYYDRFAFFPRLLSATVHSSSPDYQILISALKMCEKVEW